MLNFDLPKQNMKILAFTLTYSTKNEVDIINELFFNGLDYLHIHKPKIKKSDLIKFINNIDSKYHSKIILHQHQSLAKKYNCKIVHFGLNKLNGFFYKWYIKFLLINNQDLKITTTIYPSKLTKIGNLNLEYILLGPIYKKYSEDNIKLLFDRFKLKKWISSSKFDTVAFGSIDLSNVESIKKFDFSGVLLNSAIWKSHQPIEDFKRIFLELKNDNEKYSSKVV